MTVGTRSCLRKSSIFSMRQPSGSNGSRTQSLKAQTTIEAVPPIDDTFVNVHHGGINLVPVHRLGEFQASGAMFPAELGIALIIRQFVGHRLDVARLG